MIAPRWDEKKKRWIIQPMRDGKRYAFTSTLPGAAGKREVRRLYESWLFNEGNSGNKTVESVASEYLEDLAARCGPDPSSGCQDAARAGPCSNKQYFSFFS